MKNIVYIILMLPAMLLSQDKITGVVFDGGGEKDHVGLAGANVRWLNTTIGTITDIDGAFTLAYSKEYEKLIISYVGFKTDTLLVSNPKVIRHFLQPTSSLKEVTVTSKKQTIAKSYVKAANVITVSSDELLKSACCNLSESFETNPSIDVNFADAVTGTRQIKMLGLTNPYILIATENIPSIRGAAQTFGLSFIPGTWVESIQITKGAGSVVNGFESIAGQINAELVKPLTDNKFFINLYASGNSRKELNTHFNKKLSDKWSTGVYIHQNIRDKKFDKNNDSFLDVPLQKQVNAMSRLQYINKEKGFISFINFKILNDEKQAGQLKYDPERHKLTTNSFVRGPKIWGSEIDTKRYEVSTKLGYVNPEIPWQSVGLQTAFSNHAQESYFGINGYNIKHKSLYTNAIYNSIISDSRHKVKTGISYTHDNYKELVNLAHYDRVENSVGAFFEYSYDNLELLNITAGIRADHHNLLGNFVTPRLHMRYSPWGKSAFRASFGRGKRSANIFTENQQLFATNRQISILNSDGNIYGLDPEIAWNYGVSYLQGFNLWGKKADITLDFYKTDFVNQVIVDWERSDKIYFYNLEGKSFANSLQAEFNYTPLDHLNLRMAYKFYDVKTDYKTSGRLEKPLTSKHRFFTNVGYEIHNDDKENDLWKFDLTFNWLSSQRFASTANNLEQFQLPEWSPAVATLNAQVTKVISETFEVYLGGENITNVRQNNPILGANKPFGSNFDTTFVYGPIFGSMYYAGLRFKIK